MAIADKPALHWEALNPTRELQGVMHSDYLLERARVPGGWLVVSQFRVGGAHGLAFLPDPAHTWDGGSVR